MILKTKPIGKFFKRTYYLEVSDMVRNIYECETDIYFENALDGHITVKDDVIISTILKENLPIAAKVISGKKDILEILKQYYK